MPRAARLVVPGLPHHITQRGNRQQAIFFSDRDRSRYVEMLAEACVQQGTRCLAWCLMDNHVHLILVPATADGLRATVARTHTRYAQRINHGQGLSGHLFQGRFASYPMDDAHLMVAARYVELNPVRAGLCRQAEEWPWSSARAHIGGPADGLTDAAELGRHIRNWRAYLSEGLEAADRDDEIEAAMRSGRPLGQPALEGQSLARPYVHLRFPTWPCLA